MTAAEVVEGLDPCEDDTAGVVVVLEVVAVNEFDFEGGEKVEVVLESWTGGMVKSKGDPTRRKNVVRSAPSSRRRWALRPLWESIRSGRYTSSLSD